MTDCRVCGVTIRWAVDSSGHAIPLDEHEQLDYDPPRPPVNPVGELHGARWMIVQDGTRPLVSSVPPESQRRTFVDHRYLCMQPRAL